MLDIKPNSAFLSARNSAHEVVNSAQNSAEILLWLLMLSRHFPTHATCKYLDTIQDSRYEDQVGQFVEMTQRTVLAQVTNGIDQQST